jgi:hypothetical protein
VQLEEKTITSFKDGMLAPVFVWQELPSTELQFAVLFTFAPDVPTQ